jgi:hypothetical protein
METQTYNDRLLGPYILFFYAFISILYPFELLDFKFNELSKFKAKYSPLISYQIWSSLAGSVAVVTITANQ